MHCSAKTTAHDRALPLSLRRVVTIGLALLLTPITVAWAEPVSITATPLPLNRDKPEQTEIGSLRYMGGLELRADSDHFGGFSGLLVSDDGRSMIALSDRGWWLTAELTHDDDGRLTGVERSDIAPARRPPGRAFDPEAVIFRPRENDLLITSERNHRLISYELPLTRSRSTPHRYSAQELALFKPRVLDAPRDFASLGKNEGIEALVEFSEGRLLALEEGGEDPPDKSSRGWLIGPKGKVERLTLARSARFRPTDAASLPNGDVLVLERRYTAIGGVAARLRVLDQKSLVAGAELQGEVIAELVPPVSVDNMEGLAVHQDGNRTIVTLISDDNFNQWQRTLLLQFELLPERTR